MQGFSCRALALVGNRRAAPFILGVLIAMAVPAASVATPPPDHVGAWTVTADVTSDGAGCSLTRGDEHGRLLFTQVNGTVRLEASSDRWFASGSLQYAAHLTVDNDTPLAVLTAGEEPGTLHILPNSVLPTTPFVERLKTGRTLSLRKDGNPGLDTLTFDLAAFAAALARLDGCVTAAAARAAAIQTARATRCLGVADAAALATGGQRGILESDDRIAVALPGTSIVILCGTGSDRPSIDVWRNEPGMPPALLAVVAKLAGVLTGQPAATFAGMPSACLRHVTTYTHRRGGRRSALPGGATTYVEGEARSPRLKMTCWYYGATFIQPSFGLERL